MSKRIRRPPPLTPMRLQMLRDARDHGNALFTLLHARDTGVVRAMKIMCDLGYLELGTGAITEAGQAVLEQWGVWTGQGRLVMAEWSSRPEDAVRAGS